MDQQTIQKYLRERILRMQRNQSADEADARHFRFPSDVALQDPTIAASPLRIASEAPDPSNANLRSARSIGPSPSYFRQLAVAHSTKPLKP